MAGMRPTPAEWVDRFLALDREGRERVAGFCQQAGDDAERCWTGQHNDRIDQLVNQRRKALEALQSIHNDANQFSPAARVAVDVIVSRVSAALGSAIWP